MIILSNALSLKRGKRRPRKINELAQSHCLRMAEMGPKPKQYDFQLQFPFHCKVAHMGPTTLKSILPLTENKAQLSGEGLEL